MVLPSINERLRLLCDTDEFYDVEFQLADEDDFQTVKGHKNIFAGANEVFKVMLYGNLPEGDKIVIKDVDVKAFTTLKKFIYTNELQFESIDHAKNVYHIADKYNFDDLLEEAEKYILAKLSAQNVFCTLEFAQKYNNSSVENKCFEFIRNFTHKVLESDEFLICDLNFISTLVYETRLNISEIDLFCSIEKWALLNLDIEGSSPENGIQLLYDIINNIRFLAMSVDEFTRGPNKSPLLIVEERYSLLSNIVSPSSMPLPARFCKEVVSRKSLFSAKGSLDITQLPSPSSSDTELIDTSEVDTIESAPERLPCNLESPCVYIFKQLLSNTLLKNSLACQFFKERALSQCTLLLQVKNVLSKFKILNLKKQCTLRKRLVFFKLTIISGFINCYFFILAWIIKAFWFFSKCIGAIIMLLIILIIYDIWNKKEPDPTVRVLITPKV